MRVRLGLAFRPGIGLGLTLRARTRARLRGLWSALGCKAVKVIIVLVALVAGLLMAVTVLVAVCVLVAAGCYWSGGYSNRGRCAREANLYLLVPVRVLVAVCVLMQAGTRGAQSLGYSQGQG